MVRLRKPTGLEKNKSKKMEVKHVLVVCEGRTGYSEPAYLEGLRKFLRILEEQIVIIGSEQCQSAPISIVEYAKQEMKRADKARESYSRVFCVFDTELDPQHQSLDRAIDAISSSNKIIGIISNPKFEYWLLLHFDKKIFTLQTHGQMDKLITKHPDLKKYLESGKKIDDMSVFYKRIGMAVENCHNLGFSLMSPREIKSSNRSATNFHILVNELCKIFDRKL